MHILIIPSWYPSDKEDISGSFFREQAIALSRRGCKVGVISLQLRLLQNFHRAILDSRKISHVLDNGVNTYRKTGVKWFPVFPRLHAGYCRYYGLRLFERYARSHGRPDVVHVQSMSNAGPIAQAIYREHGIPYVVTEHLSSLGRALGSGKLDELRTIASDAHRRLAVSSVFAKLLESTLGEAVGPWEVMPNIVSDCFFSPPVRRQKNDRFSFISISLLSENKRVDLIIRSFTRAFGGKPLFRLCIVGEGNTRSSLERLVRELGVSEQVYFLGRLTREQVIKEISASDVLVLGSDFETFGIVLIEALALGKPVLATRCGGPEDIVSEGDGILIPKGDPDAMATAMKIIYNNYTSYNPEKLRNSCRLRFGESTVVDKIIKIFDEAVSERGPLKLTRL